MIKSAKKLLSFFNLNQRLQFIGLWIMQFIGSILELMGVSMLLPFVEALLSPEKLFEHAYIAWFANLFHIQNNSQLVAALLLLLIIVYVVKNIYMVLMLYVQYQIVWHNRLRMEKQVMNCFLRKPYIYHTQVQSGEIQRTLDSDIGRVFDVVNNIFLLTADMLTCLFLVLYLIRTDVTMTIAVVIFLALFIVIFIKVFKKRLYIYGATQQKYAGRVNTYVLETMRNIKEIKVYQKEPFFIRHYYQSRAIQSSMMKRGSFLQMTPKYLLEAMCVAGILTLVLLRVEGGTSIESLAPAITVFAMAAYRVMPSANHINSQLTYIVNNKVSIDTVYAVLNDELKAEEEGLLTEEEQGEVSEKKNLTLQDIALDHISYQYPNVDKKVLDDVSLVIHAGESVAFKGQSGAGKTTLVDVILGILEPQKGTILYGGKPVKTLPEKWYSHLGYIPQNIYLGDYSIRDNIAFGVEKPDDKKVWDALEKAQLEEFVRGLPNGLDTTVGESGIRLSGGQRQRIGIARALYNDPEILILDEATSALDSETENAVMEAIDSLKGTRTLIIIAHRISTIQNCDRIFTVKDGKVVE